jgi:pimeloyl-ACP methyl ester carboxylesterase
MITTAIVAWCTLLALAPPRRPFAVGAMSFLFGFVLNELPFVAFAYLLVSTWLGLGGSGVDSPSGWAVVSLAVFTAAGLAVIAWRADPAMVFIAGSSSGGQLAALAALTANDPVYQPGFEHADTSVTAAICLHGYYGHCGGQQQSPSSPLAYDATTAPPFFLAHGDQDSLIPVETARLFATKLRATSSNPVVYAELPGAQHGFDRFHSLRFEQVVDAIEAFTAWLRSRQQAGSIVMPDPATRRNPPLT